MEQRQDIVLGVLFASLGVVASWLATAYSGASGVYPLVLALIIVSLGVLIVVRALRASDNEVRALTDSPRNLILTALVFALYVGLIVPLGFFTASILLMLLLPLVLGFRRPLYLSAMAVAFIAVLFLVFSVLLEKPLPAELWSSARLGSS